MSKFLGRFGFPKFPFTFVHACAKGQWIAPKSEDFILILTSFLASYILIEPQERNNLLLKPPIFDVAALFDIFFFKNMHSIRGETFTFGINLQLLFSPTKFLKMKKYLSLLTLVLFAVAFFAFRSEDETPAPNTKPDLVITNISLQCSQPTNRWLVFSVANIGAVRNKATQIRVRPTDNNDETQKCIAQAVRAVPQLRPGDDIKLRVPLKEPPGCDCQAAMMFDLFVDHKFLVDELDETNNQEYFNIDL